VPPTIQVSARYPGASAEVVAATIGIPIEQAVNGVDGSVYMSSTSISDGSYGLTITFEVGTDLNASLALVQNLVNGALSQLPSGVQQLGITVRKVSPNILLVVSMYSDKDQFEDIFLSNYAVINLQNPLARLPGVGQVIVRGAGSYSMRVWLDRDQLQLFNITTAEVISAIQGQNAQVVAGQLGARPVPGDRPHQFKINASADCHDVVRIHHGSRSASDCERAGGSKPARNRDGGLWRYAFFHASCNTVRTGVLRGGSETERIMEK
jgi:hydrophobic/amphiphilic exporter-1 (mainly G- bacteria), HAE1 family